MRQAAREISGRDHDAPFFPASVIFDREILAMFRELHVALEVPASTLERQSRLQSFAARLITRFGERRPSTGSSGRMRLGVKRACEYLTEHNADNISLDRLAQIAGLSPFHFNRVFSEQVGMPPHAFQTQLRVGRARDLLLRGWSISQVADQTGFADQSHLTRHFKRLVGVTPGRYQQSSKNVQDLSAGPR
jgi:AraC-like DNA-binding protein